MKDSIAKELISSGKALIELGVQDYKLASRDKRRLATSARNIFDGLFAFLKARIAEDHPENNYAWLRWKNGVPTMSSKRACQVIDIHDAHTLRVNETLDYFSGNLDEARIYALRDYRNKATHFFSEITPQQAKEMLTRFFLVITDALSKIEISPSECLDAETLSYIAMETGALQEELLMSEREWYNFNWTNLDVADFIFENFRCNVCNSTLVRRNSDTELDEAFICRVCGKKYSESSLRELVCAKCECEVCGDLIIPEELESFVESRCCGWHHHINEKEMARN